MTYEIKDGFIIRKSDGAIIPPDQSNSDFVDYLEWVSAGNIPPSHIPSEAEITSMYERALDNHMDSVAKRFRYDNRFTFALRAAFPGPYHDEGEQFAIWMDQCNYLALNLLGECLRGEKPIPTLDEFINLLPEFKV